LSAGDETRMTPPAWKPELPGAAISFSSSRPAEMLFPLEEFRATVREVIDSDEAANILQLGPPSGYGPLRRHVLQKALELGVANEGDDILITSGCQQAFDLIQRVAAPHGETVLMEDPVYPGLRNVFVRGGARVIGVPLGVGEGDAGIDLADLKRLLEKEKPRLLVLTPNFQNPTGLTMPEHARLEVLAMVDAVARKTGMAIIENDLYGTLRYEGSNVPWIKQLDKSEFFEDRISGVAGRLGDRAAEVYRATDGSEGVERSAFRSVGAGGAAALHPIGAPGDALRQDGGGRAREIGSMRGGVRQGIPGGDRFHGAAGRDELVGDAAGTAGCGGAGAEGGERGRELFAR
jgi:hypothetical protein